MNHSKKYYQTKKGISARIYNRQKNSSIERGHPLPSYNLQELRGWLYEQKSFSLLFENWALSGFNRNLTPSCDRIDDYKPYSIDNLTIVTWIENNNRAHLDRVSGVNNKASHAVIQMTKCGMFIARFYSTEQAGRDTKAISSHIRSCCKGARQHAGGFRWMYAL